MNTQAEHIVETKFGGAQKMAEVTGWPLTTIRGWKDSGFIPSKRHPEIIEFGSTIGLVITPDDFFPQLREDTAA